MKMLLLCLVFVSYAHAYVDESVLMDLRTTDHWNAFRIALPNTANECFYLETKLDDTIHVIYQVIKGGDSHVRAVITNPLGNVTFAESNREFGWYDEENSKISGTYQICFKNEQYFTTKILYIGVLAIHKDLVLEANINAAEEKKTNGTAFIEEFSTTVMKSLGNMSSTLYYITAFQTIARVHHAHDIYWVEANANYVQNWALCQMITMALCSVIQVFSIRRLFKSTSSTKSSLRNSNPPTSPHFIITS